MAPHFLTLYWAIGGLLILPVIDNRLARIVEMELKFTAIKISDVKAFWITFIAICIAAFFWPVITLPKRKS